MSDFFLGKKEIDDALLEEIETALLVADVGIETTTRIVEQLTELVSRRELMDSEALYAKLKELLIALLKPCEKAWELPRHKPHVMLMVGVNGSGKTTTIGKLAKKVKQAEKSVILAAGDTFRAAAVEQLQTWGERNDVPVIAQQTGGDSASVAYDAVHAAQARGVDVAIVDTAGRLHTQSHLMEELKKVTRVMKKVDKTAPHEVWLVLDAGIGQNALIQAQQFHQAIGLTGLVLTKLDGTAKGGIIFAIAHQLQLPIYFIGVGERVGDLQPFQPEKFVEALFSSSS